MKIDPISTHERAVIIAHLASRGKWTDKRNGCTVSMARFEDTEQVHYFVHAGHRKQSGLASSLDGAIEMCNTLLTLPRTPEPTAGRAVRDDPIARERRL